MNNAANKQDQMDGRWDAGAYFKQLTQSNRLAAVHGFRFFAVSGLQGFEDIVNAMQQCNAFVCVSDESDGMLQLDGTPHLRQVKTVFLGMRHSVNTSDTGGLRQKCFGTLRELFRQFMSALLKERSYLEQGTIYVDPNIQFTEISRYFLHGCACAYFQITVTRYNNLIFRPDEWE